MSNIILTEIMEKNKYNAGTKARDDVTNILKNAGFQTVVLFDRTHNTFYRFVEIIKATRNIAQNINQNDLVVLQYPYRPIIMELIIWRISKLRRKVKCRLILLIHDVVYLRKFGFGSENTEKMKRFEIRLFNKANAIIVHNAVMKSKLQSIGINIPMYELNLFDYIYYGINASNITSDKPILVFAGNLSPAKSGFLYTYKNNGTVRFNLYGTNHENINLDFNYMGSYPPEELIPHIEGNYGLVWDGTSSNGCEGNYGRYIRYNSPHKLSLYIAAGIPVIVWNESAVSKFVTDHCLGVAISSLVELNSIPHPGSIEYQKLLNGISRIQQKLCKGGMLLSVISRINETN
jgi:hypothetical protein